MATTSPAARRPDDGFAELLLQYDPRAVDVSIERGNERGACETTTACDRFDARAIRRASAGIKSGCRLFPVR